MEKERMEAELKKARTEISRFVQKINEQDTFIDKISAELEKLNSIQTDEKAELKKHLHELRNSRILTDEDWTSFKDGFDWLYPYFSDSIRRHSPNITLAELRYLMLTKLGFTHKQMSLALGIAPDSLRVTWNRVRNKLGGTPEDTPGSLLEKVERSTVEMI